jgi:hypothetical protein
MYRPYILGSRETGTYAPKRQRIAERKETIEPSGQIYVLNKSLKNEIVNYAHNVTYGVTGFRSSVSMSSADMENFNRNIHRDGFEAAKEYIAQDLAEFADKYNKASEFMQTQEQSAALKTYSFEIADNLRYNRDRLQMLGISVDDDGKVGFNKDFFKGMNQDQINVAIGENIRLFTDLLKHSGDFLTDPLVDHMKFKGLGYHYNYKMGMMETDGFNTIEAGLLINKAV